MELEAAQRQLVAAYANGATGVLVSGLVWLAAGLVQRFHGDPVAFATLFFGGMLIQPGAMLLGRLLPKMVPLPKGNPLERLALESTVGLFAGLLIGYLLLRTAPALTFPAIALAIGARYFVFRTLYDEPVYWLLGGTIAAVATAAAFDVHVLMNNLVLNVAAIEIVGAMVLFGRWNRSASRSAEKTS